MNKFYIRIWGRPLGAEPKIYKSLEEAQVNHEPCEYGCSPWCEPNIKEFNTEFEARRWLQMNYPLSYEEMKTYAY